MNVVEKTLTPAQVYEDRFVPALFRQWGPIVAQAARIKPGDAVLDVGCGTGVLALSALQRVGPQGAVTGLDANPDMIAVARQKNTDIRWCDGQAESLPFPDQSFDAVVSQFAMMFFDNRVQALREMMRVLRLKGNLAVAVCDAVERSPGYGAFARLLEKLFGGKVAEAFRAPFVLGDEAKLSALCIEAGIEDADIARHSGKVRFPSISALVSTERACVWTLGGLLDEEQFARLLHEAEKALEPFTGRDGAIHFEMPALILTASRKAR
jgi:SAM-dependent methyltransferase